MPFSFARTQPGEVLTLRAAHAVGVDAELLDPILPGICGRRVHREADPTSVALVVRGSQDDGGCTLAQLVGNRERVEQKEVVAELDPVRGNELGPVLLLVPVRMRRLPMPDTGAQLAYGRDGIAKTVETSTQLDRRRVLVSRTSSNLMARVRRQADFFSEAAVS